MTNQFYKKGRSLQQAFQFFKKGKKSTQKHQILNNQNTSVNGN